MTLISAAGYLCQRCDLWQVLVAANVRGSTIESTCNDLVNGPDSNTVRGYVNQQLKPEKIRVIQQDTNQVSWLLDSSVRILKGKRANEATFLEYHAGLSLSLSKLGPA
jgi:hypothetical protein